MGVFWPVQAATVGRGRCGRPTRRTAITFVGDRHTVAFSGNRCIDKPLEAFFIEGTLPPADLHC